TIQFFQFDKKNQLDNVLRPDMELFIPSGKTVQSSTTVVKNDEIIYVVQPKETLFVLTQKYQVTQEELIENNQQLKNGLKINDTIRIPLKKQEESNSTSEKEKVEIDEIVISNNHDYKNLLRKLDNTTQKEVVFMLP